MMLQNWHKRLVMINVAVFLAVLSIFCTAVYLFGCSAFDTLLKDKLVSIADSAISSIDFDDFDQTLNGKPDLIVSVLPSEASPALQPMRIQWFDARGTLDIEKGTMPLALPLETSEGFQLQTTPPALVFTKPALAKGKLLGYVRVGHPLSTVQQQKGLLLQWLISGSLVAVTVGSIGIYFLVRQSLRPVEESIKTLKRFCADAAHELRTPITAILTNSSVALRHGDGMRSGDREKFEAITSGARQIELLTEDLLMLARAEQLSEQGYYRKYSTLQSLNEEVRSAMECAGRAAEKKNLSLHCEISESLSVYIDTDDLKCILRNLMDNAIKYTPERGKITISAATSSGGIRLTIADTGIGISSADLTRIFDRFWRADQARSYHSGGNGLGLPIVKAIVEKYGGSIAVSSEIGKGTTFRMQLPGTRTATVLRDSV